MKVCSRCKQELPLTAFSRDPSKKSGYSSACSKCRYKNQSTELARSRTLSRLYGISLDEFDKLRLAQGFCCKICGLHEVIGDFTLHVDHDHRTGKIRALLCPSCNLALGHFRDDVKVMQDAIEYLREHAGN